MTPHDEVRGIKAGADRGPSPGIARRAEACQRDVTRPAGDPNRVYALPSGTATNLVASPDFTRISTVFLPAFCRSASC
jgi:hypothetical protein